jgi:hypothetical protein
MFNIRFWIYSHTVVIFVFIVGNTSPLALHGRDLKLLSVKVNGTELKVILRVIYFFHIAPTLCVHALTWYSYVYDFEKYNGSNTRLF